MRRRTNTGDTPNRRWLSNTPPNHKRPRHPDPNYLRMDPYVRGAGEILDYESKGHMGDCLCTNGEFIRLRWAASGRLYLSKEFLIEKQSGTTHLVFMHI